MNQKQIFEVGIRLLGLYFFLQGIPLLLTTIFELLVAFRSKGEIFTREHLLTMLSIVAYSLFVVFGIWLTKGATFFRRMALREADDESISDLAVLLFIAGVKLFGVSAAIGMIPRLMRSLSFFFLAQHSSTPIQFMGDRGYFVPHIVSILFGLLLFFRGELLSSWAFADREALEDVD